MTAVQIYNSRTWKELRPVVLWRDGWVCQIKGPKCTKVATCVDHIDPGHPDPFDPQFLRAACVPCNSARRCMATLGQPR